MKVSVIGTGYVGLTTGVALAYLGHEVVGVDKDEAKVARMRDLKSPIHEHGLEELMHHARRHLSFTTNTVASVADADVLIIAVGTPQRRNGAADTRFVQAAAQEVAAGLQPGRHYTIIIKSTVPIGTNGRVSHDIERVLREREVSVDYAMVSSPEFLREGTALHDTLYPDRIVAGSHSPQGIDQVRRLFDPILSQSFAPPSFLPRPERLNLPRFVSTDPTSAEMIKYSSNAFLALKISFINEIGGLCEKVGADVTEVAKGMGLDHRIGRHFLGAGLGWGGSCFPKDTAALLSLGEEYSYTMPIVAATREVNERQRQQIVEKLQTALKVLRGRTVAMLGLAFKPGTDDIRDAPAIDIAHALVERGVHVRVHDPIAMDNARKPLEHPDVEFVNDPYGLVEGADAVVLATEWPQYADLDLDKIASLMRTPLLVDGRNLFDPKQAHEAGLDYLGVGR